MLFITPSRAPPIHFGPYGSNFRSLKTLIPKRRTLNRRLGDGTSVGVKRSLLWQQKLVKED